MQLMPMQKAGFQTMCHENIEPENHPDQILRSEKKEYALLLQRRLGQLPELPLFVTITFALVTQQRFVRFSCSTPTTQPETSDNER